MGEELKWLLKGERTLEGCYNLSSRNLEDTPMVDELKWFLKGGHIFESCDISLENTHVRPPHTRLV